MPYKNPLNLEQKARRAKQAKERRSKKSVAPDVAPEYVAPKNSLNKIEDKAFVLKLVRGVLFVAVFILKRICQANKRIWHSL